MEVVLIEVGMVGDGVDLGQVVPEGFGLTRVVSNNLTVDFEGNFGGVRIVFSLNELEEFSRVGEEIRVGLVTHPCNSVFMVYPHCVYDTLYKVSICVMKVLGVGVS